MRNGEWANQTLNFLLLIAQALQRGKSAFPPLPIIIKHRAAPVLGLSIFPNFLGGRMNCKQYQVPKPREEPFESQKERRSTTILLLEYFFRRAL